MASSGREPDEDAIAAVGDESVPRDVMPNVNVMFSEMAIYHPTRSALVSADGRH